MIDSVSKYLLAIQGGRFYNLPGQCPGDSGGPVMVVGASEGKRRAVAGVTSTSRELDGFCLLGAVHTRVEPHSGWIKNTVANFRNAALRANPENAAAIQNAFALDTEVCCGDGFLEPGELCDGNCPTSCDDHDPTTKDTLLDVGTCQARCAETKIEPVGSGAVNSENIMPEPPTSGGGGCNATRSNSLGGVLLLITLFPFVLNFRRRNRQRA